LTGSLLGDKSNPDSRKELSVNHLRLLALTLLLGACDPVPEVDPTLESPRLNREVAFVVNDFPVYQDVFELNYSQDSEETIEYYEEMRLILGESDLDETEIQTYLDDAARKEATELAAIAQKIRDRLGTMELLYRRALADGYALDTSTLVQLQQSAAIKLEWAEKTYVISQMSDAMMSEEPTPEEIQTWYETNRLKYKETMLDIRQLTVADGALANSLRTQIEEGADFDALVAAHSIDELQEQSGRVRGDELVALSELDEENKALFEDAGPGTVIGPRQGRDGQWIILFVAHRELQVPSLEELEEAAVEGAKVARFNVLIDEVKAELEFSLDSTRPSAPEATP
jgi:hypothetical protein